MNRVSESILRAAAVSAVALVAVLSVGAGQASATHLSCGDTITQDTTFDRDLIGCSGEAGVRIGADRIKLDLNGHRIEGQGGSPAYQSLAYGVLNEGHQEVTIENGNVAGADIGVGFLNAHNNTLRAMRIIRGLYGDAGDPALSLWNSNGNRIEDSAFFGWARAVLLVQSSDNRISNNRTGYFRCGQVGDCDVIATGGTVQVAFGSANLFEGNSFSQGPLVLLRTDGNSVRRNSVTLSILSGIESREGVGNEIEKNDVYRNLDYGILVGSTARVEKNVVRDNYGDGIHVNGASEILGNRASRNEGDGIHVDSPGALIQGNVANENFSLGIEAVPGVIDGGGNKAFANGNPLQCLNVVCK